MHHGPGLYFVFSSPEHTTGLYIPQIEGFLFNNPSFFAVEHMGLESELGRGREGLRAVGMETWRKAYPVCFLLQNRGGSLVWCFPMPPIPIVLKRSILFLLAYCAVGSVDNQIMLLF